ncbi:MAG: sigma-70 family RNA polymerase sigma factor [Solirubrobacterales bacterium]|nr:sigma-70 family RNA polymerase sigma factor [Solirubrobacterales bacterium]MBV9806219.1 sigma-70 family RNA polymerase sigma factor [Solirubrobacterales bacterium]
MTHIEETARLVAAGDVGELYGLLARRLEHIVRLDVRAPDAVIEDACQFAWSRLLHHRHRVHRDTVVTWLARTAVHEAFKLLRRDRRELSLDTVAEDAIATPAPPSGSPHELAECRERLAGIGRLPVRQQRVLWLHALGLNYAEIADYEECTLRTVERQLLRARRRISQEDDT